MIKNEEVLFRKKLVFGLISIVGFISIIFICSCQMRQIANLGSQGKNIICFGDSLTFGYNVGTSNSYPSILSKMIEREVINAGRDGDTVAMAWERLEKDVLEKNPLLVIIILGANDFLRGIPKSQTFDDLKTIIKRIKVKGAMVALGELGPFNMYNYKEEYKKLAEAENLLLIKDILGGIFGHPELMLDSVHPNSQGYVKIAEKVYKAILPILEKNRKVRGQKKTPLTFSMSRACLSFDFTQYPSKVSRAMSREI